MPEKPSPEATTAAAVDAPEKPQPKPKPPARELPSQADVARWVEGEDVESLENLFNLLNTKLFDAKFMQLKKEELLPQHWQVISRLTAPDDAEFDRLGEVARLRERYGSGETADRRIAALRVAWRELRGKQPALWSASDVFSALRRIIDRKLEVGFHDLLSAVRDVWRGLTLPHGREQLEVLWACLDFIRSKTKK